MSRTWLRTAQAGIRLLARSARALAASIAGTPPSLRSVDSLPRFHPENPKAFVDELERQIRQHILAQMPADSSGELAQKSLHDLLLTYGNWRSRFVRTQPRAALLSSRLQSSPKFAEHKTALDAIVKEIEAGQDLTPRLSRGVTNAYQPSATRATRLHKRRDLDLLIADWGLHHLHLGTSLDPDGFIARTGDLLFAGFSDDQAYLIGVYPHGSWALQELVEILVTEWPGNPLVRTLSGFSLVQPKSDVEHLDARKGGTWQFVEVNGALYMAGGGMTTAGTSVDITSRCHRIMEVLDKLRSDLPAILTELDKQLPPESPDEIWEPLLDGDTFGLKRGPGRVPIADLW